MTFFFKQNVFDSKFQKLVNQFMTIFSKLVFCNTTNIMQNQKISIKELFWEND